MLVREREDGARDVGGNTSTICRLFVRTVLAHVGQTNVRSAIAARDCPKPTTFRMTKITLTMGNRASNCSICAQVCEWLPKPSVKWFGLNIEIGTSHARKVRGFLANPESRLIPGSMLLSALT